MSKFEVPRCPEGVVDRCLDCCGVRFSDFGLSFTADDGTAFPGGDDPGVRLKLFSKETLEPTESTTILPIGGCTDVPFGLLGLGVECERTRLKKLIVTSKGDRIGDVAGSCNWSRNLAPGTNLASADLALLFRSVDDRFTDEAGDFERARAAELGVVVFGVRVGVDVLGVTRVVADGDLDLGGGEVKNRAVAIGDLERFDVLGGVDDERLGMVVGDFEEKFLVVAVGDFDRFLAVLAGDLERSRVTAGDCDRPVEDIEVLCRVEADGDFDRPLK